MSMPPEGLPETFHNPPIFAAIAAVTFFAVVHGVIFKDALEYQVGRWQANRLTQATIEYQRPLVVLNYLGLCLWTALFLGLSLTVFGFALWFGLLLGAILAVLVGGLMWWQLGQIFKLLVQAGSAALELDFLPGDP
ncbi:MAG: hypothetical protein Q6J78_02265 [Thermostichales cyanobacterium SRBZ-1_bins_19]